MKEFSEYYPRLVGWFIRRGFEARAEDLAQETFLRAHRSHEQLRDHASYGGWLFAIARRVVYDQPKPVPQVEVGGELEDPRPSPDDSAAWRRCLECVERETSSLPPRMRQAFRLRTSRGLPYREIARALRITESAARAHVAHARKRLSTRCLGDGEISR